MQRALLIVLRITARPLHSNPHTRRIWTFGALSATRRNWTPDATVCSDTGFYLGLLHFAHSKQREMAEVDHRKMKTLWRKINEEALTVVFGLLLLALIILL